MTRPRPRLLATAATTALAGALLAAMAAVPSTATTGVAWYAAPHGSGTTCSKAAPCDIATAVSQAPSGATVYVEPGTYFSAAAPSTTTIEAGGPIHLVGLTRHGKAPVLYLGAPSEGLALLNVADKVSHLTIDYSGQGEALLSEGAADHLTVISTGVGSTACDPFFSISDSLCLATGEEAIALIYSQAGSGSGPPPTETFAARNVTAVSTGKASAAMYAVALDDIDVTVDLTNVILKSTDSEGADLVTDADDQSALVVNLSHSDFKTRRAGLGNTAQVNVDATDTDALPRFRNVARLDFREAKGSPTIDRGARTVRGDTDLAGLPRKVGKAADIGAFEYAVAPKVGALRVRALSTSSVTVTVPVNPRGLPAKVQLLAKAGHKTLHSKVVSLAATAKSEQVKLRLGLHRHTRYVLRAVATSAAGTSSSPPKSISSSLPRHQG